MSEQRYYIYGVTRAAMPLPDALMGLKSRPVAFHGWGRLAACISGLPEGRLRPQRSHLAAHQDVIRRLSEVGDLLPMSFGMVAESLDEVEALLREHADDLSAELDRVGGCVEFGVRLSRESEDIFGHFVNAHPELADLARRVAAAGEGATRDLLMDTGRAFERVLNADRESHAGMLIESIGPFSREWHLNPPKTEREVVDLACLVERDATDAFERAVEHAASRLDESFVVDLTGPWPPHHFVSLQLTASVGGV
ncbi:MAG: GvpL/GvpF family gas vesicle protein [Phycisphaerales bacterium]